VKIRKGKKKKTFGICEGLDGLMWGKKQTGPSNKTLCQNMEKGKGRGGKEMITGYMENPQQDTAWGEKMGKKTRKQGIITKGTSTR